MDTEEQSPGCLVDGLRVNETGVNEFLWINPGKQAGESAFNARALPCYDRNQISSRGIQPKKQHQVVSPSMSGNTRIRIIHPPLRT